MADNKERLMQFSKEVLIDYFLEVHFFKIDFSRLEIKENLKKLEALNTQAQALANHARKALAEGDRALFMDLQNSIANVDEKSMQVQKTLDGLLGIDASA